MNEATRISTVTPARNTAIDVMRYGLAFVVVLLHSLPVGKDDYPTWVPLISILCRVSVPFFFITSGYFLRQASQVNAAAILKPVQRLVPIYLFWMLVYFIFLHFVPVRQWSFRPGDLISGGAAFHLWFLPALCAALVLVSGCIGLAGMRATGAVCLLLAVLGLCLGSYHEVLGMPGSAQRGGLLISPLFVYLGVLTRLRNWSLGRWAIPAILLSYLLLGLEEWLIYRLSAAPLFVSHDFTIATYLVGITCFLGVRQWPGSKILDRAVWFGRLSLSVYAGHVLFLWMLAPIIGKDTLGQVAVLAILCFALSTLLSLVLMRIPALRRVVS